MQEIGPDRPVCRRADVTVLVTAEAGTGTRRVARAVHPSTRRSRPFVINVDSAAVWRELLENASFRRERGRRTRGHREEPRTDRWKSDESRRFYLKTGYPSLLYSIKQAGLSLTGPTARGVSREPLLEKALMTSASARRCGRRRHS